MFKRLIAIVLLALTLFYPSAYSFAKQETNIPIIPTGTTIPVNFGHTINSNTQYIGDIVPITIVEDVNIEGKTIFKKGDIGTVELENVIHTGGHGRAGLIEIRNGRIKDVYGKNHNVQLSILNKGESKRASAITLSVIGVFLIFIPFGIWREGTPAIISGNTIFNAIITEN